MMGYEKEMQCAESKGVHVYRRSPRDGVIAMKTKTAERLTKVERR